MSWESGRYIHADGVKATSVRLTCHTAPFSDHTVNVWWKRDIDTMEEIIATVTIPAGELVGFKYLDTPMRPMESQLWVESTDEFVPSGVMAIVAFNR